jgi:molybdenum cofactor cytidylyltransferase
MDIVGILLAAGSGERFGGDKLLVPLPGSEPPTPLGVVACRNLVAAVSRTIAVVRPGDEALATALAGAGARVVECANAAAGMGTSLACAVGAAREADGWVVTLADMPWILPTTIAGVAGVVAKGALVVAPFHRGVRGHPVGFGKGCRAALAGLHGDAGAKAVIAAHEAGLVRLDVVDPGILRDVDTPRDLAL